MQPDTQPAKRAKDTIDSKRPPYEYMEQPTSAVIRIPVMDGDDERPLPPPLRTLVRQRDATQRDRIALSNYIKRRRRDGLPYPASMNEIYALTLAVEEKIETVFPQFLAKYPIWDEWLNGVKGIDVVLAAQLLADLDINKAPYPSSFWKFAGLGVNEDGTRQRRIRGQRCDYNPNLRKVCWKIAVSFRKVGGFYKQLYNERVADERRRHPEKVVEPRSGNPDSEGKIATRTKFNDSHIRNRALRWVAKIFLAHLHERWAALEGRAPRPYVIEHLKHAHYIAPPEREKKGCTLARRKKK